MGNEDISPAPRYGPTLDQLIDKLIAADPAEKVVQLNHLFDMPTGVPLACGWVTTTSYLKDFGVAPLSSYADPIERRMPAATASPGTFPLPFGTTGLMTAKFDTAEIVIGPELHDSHKLFRSTLPTWFNFLNLGIEATVTSDSDSHMIVNTPVGLPRNYLASSVDPRDKAGTDYSKIDLVEYVRNIKAHRLTVSAGPIVMMSAKSQDGSTADIGGTVTGKHVTFTVDVKAPSWGWFDTIEIFANTEPIPVDDKTDQPMQGTAADPAVFYKPYHIPRYTYTPAKTFKVSDGTLTNWKEENGVISASVTFDLDVSEDTWVVAVAHGTKTTKGYRSLFPIVTHVLIDDSKAPETFDPANIEALNADNRVDGAAWGLTNPIFIDFDGDGFKAKYVRDGTSPVTK